MLEAITDFWKPLRKMQPQTKSKLSELRLGSEINFGYLPQASLSNRRLKVTAINSYQFGTDVLTSFVLSQENDLDVSLIVAQSQDEQYLAISRKLSISERIKLFEDRAIDNVINKNEISKITCRDNIPELKGWLIGSYKREIKGMKGFLHRADLRDDANKTNNSDEFLYSLLGSDSNEHALEIEAYKDGQIDVYATIYRRTSDIANINNEVSTQPTQIVKLVSINDINEEDKEAYISEETNNLEDLYRPNIPVLNSPVISKNTEAVQLKDMELPQLEPTILEPKIEKETIIIAETVNDNSNNNLKENEDMLNQNTSSINGANGTTHNDFPVTLSPVARQDIRTISKAPAALDNESVECELHVANQIIEEAIRSEMRLSDVVRRIIALPVSHKEAVQIPITLADDDYALLAIRYGISASDRNAIKLRIIQDLGDFSGSKKKNS